MIGIPFLPSKGALIGAAAAAAVIGGLSWALWSQIGAAGEAKGALGAEKALRSAQAASAQQQIDEAAVAAAQWKALWERSTAEQVAERRRADELERARREALKNADASARRLRLYLESVNNDPTACVNQPVPPAVDSRLRDAAGMPADRDNGAGGDIQTHPE